MVVIKIITLVNNNNDDNNTNNDKDRDGTDNDFKKSCFFKPQSKDHYVR